MSEFDADALARKAVIASHEIDGGRQSIRALFVSAASEAHRAGYEEGWEDAISSVLCSAHEKAEAETGDECVLCREAKAGASR